MGRGGSNPPLRHATYLYEQQEPRKRSSASGALVSPGFPRKLSEITLGVRRAPWGPIGRTPGVTNVSRSGWLPARSRR